MPDPGVAAHVDRATAPCDDFYRFANGAWLATATIPAEEAAWGAFYEIRERNLAELREICEHAARAQAPSGSVARKVGDLYASGMDEDAIERAALAPLAEDFARIERLSDTSALPELLGDLHAREADAPFRLGVLPDAKDSDRYLVQLQQGGLGLPDRDYYLRNDAKSQALREQYRAHVRRTFALLGESEERADAHADLVMRLESRLARASMTRVEQRDPYKVYNKRRAADLTDVAPGFDWPAYFATLRGPSIADVNLRQPDFFAEVASMTREIPLTEWRTYLRWHLVRAAAPHLTQAFVDERFAFYGRTLTGAQQLKPRWKRVVETVDHGLGEALGQLYVERVFPPEAKRRVLDVVENLRAALRERIRSLEWMGPATKAQALRKLEKFRVKMGYPDRWRDYSALAIDRGP